MCQKWEGDCGLWVLNEMIKKIKFLEILPKFDMFSYSKSESSSSLLNELARLTVFSTVKRASSFNRDLRVGPKYPEKHLSTSSRIWRLRHI